jgi:N-carbamoylputrescine amidase
MLTVSKIAWIQGKSQGSRKANSDYYTKKITDASKTGSKLIVLPELFLWDYFPIKEDKKNFDEAIELSSSEIEHYKKLALELKVNLALPIFEKRDDGIYHNSILLVDEKGSIYGHYRKMHIPDDPGFYEKYYFTPGDLGFVVVPTSVGKIGLLICWDQWFPEAARINALRGADLILYPTAIAWDTNDPKEIHERELESWQMIMRSHAIANNVHVLAVNRVGQEGHLKFWGHSFLADPYGSILVENSEDEEISSAEIDFSKKDESRKVWPFFRDRRVDKYDSLLKIWDN